MNQDTICALATANGIGAIGIIRVSGDQSFEIVSKVFQGKNLEKADSHTVYYGFIVDGKSEVGSGKSEVESNIQHPTSNIQPETIDEVMVSVFKAPKTFTAEDSVEISFHGSPHIAKKILEVLIKNGARMAKAGEFTMRAFMNGRIDLSQAESIADLIASENEASRKVALNQLKGGITNEISILRNDLLNFTSLIELELDFAEEDVEFADRSAMVKLIFNLKNKLGSLIDSFQFGNAVKNGVDVAIIGKPNAGKSTLLNALLKEERAIVSDIAGTTRDTIEEILHISGTAFRFIDTAGIRETTDTIEEIGVRKAKEKIATAKVLLYLYDEFDSTVNDVVSFVKEFYRKDLEIVLIHNKIDLSKNTENHFDTQLSAELLPDFVKKIIGISAKENQGIEQVISVLKDYIENLKTEESNVVITNQRHYEALQKSLDSVKRVENAISGQIHTELLAYELRNALEHLGEISGEFTNDEVLGNIFSKFCIGK
ncbi:tRNA uridine-5-carboxymethylaminomethyl(34) synthesis GTPase MnmE [Chryseobacterium sp.]|uniref:tRNA uridine-5-carboxymethylaminomethyl(34) synthesis GTPase MnmE n=1 Tax=Chryseobacterium sp. TaxID=1871047 RepID=UPI002898A125|nr:tRNA uridine-5-carboxymethylaminomethyl(34) synthesis GTPase MnmE [Chryseobacterium sp.]